MAGKWVFGFFLAAGLLMTVDFAIYFDLPLAIHLLRFLPDFLHQLTILRLQPYTVTSIFGEISLKLLDFVV